MADASEIAKALNAAWIRRQWSVQRRYLFPLEIWSGTIENRFRPRQPPIVAMLAATLMLR